MVSLREFELASDDYEVALGLSTTDTMKYHILTNRSVLKSAVRNFQGAYDDLIQAYRWDTTNVAVLVNLGSACDELGKSDESVMYLMKAIEQDSTCYLAYINLGFHYQTKGEHQLAIDFFDKSLSIEENDPVSLNNRSYSKLQLGDVDGAMEDVSASLKGYPENSYAYRNRALIYLRMNKKNKACADLETAVEKGFTEEYGNEVEKLLKEHCGK